MPNFPATDFAVIKPSPVAIITRIFDAFNVVNASIVLSLIGSETDSKPATFPSTARNITLAPVARNSSACICNDSY